MRHRRTAARILPVLVACSLTLVTGGRASAATVWFGTPVNHYVAETPWVAVTGDVDNDSRPDLVVSSYRPAQITVMRNTATGWRHANYPSGGSTELVLADMDSDGRLDVVTPGSGGLYVHRNLGDGYFDLPLVHPISTPGLVAAADLDGDGHDDAVVNGVVDGQSGIIVLRGDGTGRFSTLDQWVRPEGRDIVLADLNDDDRPDVVVTHIAPSGVEVRLNRGDGTFGSAKGYAAGGNLPIESAAADFNRDGRTDLAVLHRDEFAVLTNTGGGTFGSPKNFPAAPENIGTGSLTAGDVDGDGRVDLAFGVYGANSVSVVENLGSGRFGAPVLYPVHLTPMSVAIADFDDDGRPDLALANSDSDDVSILHQTDEPPPADLELGVAVTPEVNAGGQVYLNARLNNRGPLAANAVEYRVELPAGARLVAPQTPYHYCRQDEAALTCRLGTVPAATEEHIGLRIMLPEPADVAWFRTRVDSATLDPDPTDNASGAATRVVPAAATIGIDNPATTQRAGTDRVVSVTAPGVVDGTPVALTVSAGQPGSGVPTGAVVSVAASPTGRGYWVASDDGSVSAQGDAAHHGDGAGVDRAGPVVEIAATPSGNGYWLADADGAVSAFGDAPALGSLNGRVAAGQPIVGLAPTPSGDGYWLVGSDGAVTAFGDAQHYGSKEGKPLPAPIMGLRPTLSGRGYWLFGANGAVHAYGDAAEHGELDGMPRYSPVVDLVPTPSGSGYWLLEAGGAIYAEGDAVHHGNPAGRWPSSGYLRAMAARPDGRGYWVVADDSAVFAYGDADFFGPKTTAGTFAGHADLTYTALRPGVTIATASMRTTGGGWTNSAPTADTWVETTAPPAPPPAPPSGGQITPSAPDPGGSTAGTASGYWMMAADGAVYAFGDARHAGNVATAPGVRAVDLEPTPSGAGYWIVDDAGHVFAHGDAPYLGGVQASVLGGGERVASLSGTPTGRGYWIFTTRGRELAFGDAQHLGDMSTTTLNGEVLDSIPTPTGHGYYMVAADGGIFTFGDARFNGSMGGQRLNAPVQSLVPDPDGEGYWLVASDGGVFSFGAAFRGSMGNVRLNRPVTGMVAFGDGYLMVGEDGGIFNFSHHPFSGSLGGHPPAHPIVSVAALS